MVAKAVWRFSMAVLGRKDVLFIVRGQARIVEAGVLGCGADAGCTTEESQS